MSGSETAAMAGPRARSALGRVPDRGATTGYSRTEQSGGSGVARRVAGTARSRAGGTGEAVLAAAKRLFLMSGYDGVNLEAVGEAAGVTRQTVYNLFGSKEAVFRAVVDLHWAEIARDYARAFSFDPALGAEGVLRQLGQAILRFIEGQDQIAFTRLVIAESRNRPWVAEDFYRVGKQPLMRAFAASLSQLHEAGRIDCPHPEIAAHQFLGLVQEFLIWPRVMAIGPDAEALPPSDRVIDEAVLTFLSRYGRRAPR